MLKIFPYSFDGPKVYKPKNLLYISDGLLSYSCPQGARRGLELDLSDRTYDGKEESGYLSQGLGQLVDGQKGHDNFRLDIAGRGKGKVKVWFLFFLFFFFILFFYVRDLHLYYFCL